MDFLTKEDILAVKDLQTEEVEVWGGKVFVRELTQKERTDLEISSYRSRDKGEKAEDEALRNFKLELVIKATVNENMEQLFVEADKEWLNKKSANSITKISDVAMKLAGFRAEDVEDLTKNL